MAFPLGSFISQLREAPPSPLRAPPPGPGWDLLSLDLSSSHLFIFFSYFDFSRFCVGDKFFLKNNMILCQMDYEEGQLNGTFESQVQ